MSRSLKIAEKKPTDPGRECVRLQALAELANRHAERAPELRDYLRDHPELRRYITSLSAAVKDGMLEKLVGGGAGSKTLLAAHVQELQEKLSSSNPTGAETLLVEAVVMCWLRVQYVELHRTQSMDSDCSFRQIEHAEKVLTQAYSRYTRALTALAKVQRITLPMRIVR